MTIICTEEERERMIETIVKSSFCPLVGHCTDSGDCEKCAPKKIKWVIQEENGDG